jgi:hypothetical protein
LLKLIIVKLKILEKRKQKNINETIVAWSKMAILTSLELLNKFSRSLDFRFYPAQGMIVVFVIIAKANF